MISRYCPASNGTTCCQAYQCCGKLCSSTTGSPSPASATCRRAPRTSTKRCVTPGTCGNGRAPEPAGESPAWQACRALGTEPPAGDGLVIVMGSSSGELLARKEEPGTAAVPVTRITFGLLCRGQHYPLIDEAGQKAPAPTWVKAEIIRGAHNNQIRALLWSEAMDKHAGWEVCCRCEDDGQKGAASRMGAGLLASAAGRAVAWVAVRRRGLEGQCAGVDAVAPAGGTGPVAVDMAQMTAAAAADHLGAAQQPALVRP